MTFWTRTLRWSAVMSSEMKLGWKNRAFSAGRPGQLGVDLAPDRGGVLCRRGDAGQEAPSGDVRRIAGRSRCPRG